MGMVDEEIAAKLGIGRMTLHRWRLKHPELQVALSHGKDYANAQVIAAHYKRAIGYDYTERLYEGTDGEGKPVLKRATVKHVAGDVIAQIFWLKNRMPTEWKDKHEVEGRIETFTILPPPKPGEGAPAPDADD